METIPPAMPSPVCPHAPERVASPRSDRCEECGSAVNLRMCADCGHVGCCESQAGHNTLHAREAGHPVIYSMPVGAGWAWCYEEKRYVG